MMVGRGETVHRKRVGKTSGMTLSVKELWQKPRRAATGSYKRSCRSKVRRQPEKKGPLGLDGRQAKARYCFREIGKGNAEIPG